VKPPFHVPPDVLFRRMLELPRPSKAIDYRIRGAEHIPLVVRAVTWHDEVDGTMLSYIQRSLWTPDGQAFGSADDVGSMAESEVADLANAVFEALLEVSPSYQRAGWPSWVDQLKIGAADWRNLTTAIALADCVDEGCSATRPHPERYWGVRPCDLTDGQRMVAHAALVVVNKMREEQREANKPSPSPRRAPGRY